MSKSPSLQTGLLFLGLALITAAVYWPGMGGGFILDDFPNLALLSLLPEDASLAQIINLSGNGIASDLGRPLSMVSFLLQAAAWPDHPASFKLINLLLHISNGAVLVFISQQLARADEKLHLSPVFLIAAVALWLLHPIQVSGVLYVVQRMNLLASLFVLLGIYCYLWSRNHFAASGRLRFGLAMVAAPLVFSVLGLLSKENGVLLYAYLLVLEFTLLAGSPCAPPLKKAIRLAVYLPLLIGLIGFLFYLPGALEAYEQKPFTISERSLSQIPVLATYLFTLLLPYSSHFGLFHDSFPLYDSLFALPVLLAAIVIGLLLSAALRLRKQQPFFAFAVLWYFAGHALESTILPLELYFEHRNYLPSAGIPWGLALILNQLPQTALLLPAWAGTKKVAASAAVLAIAWLGLLTTLESSLWGNPLDQAQAEIARRPASYRAQTHLVQTVTSSGDPRAGFELHQQLISSGETRISDMIRWLEFACILDDIALPAASQIESVASAAQIDYAVVGQYNRLIPAVLNDTCPAALLPALTVSLESLLDNPSFAAAWPDLLYGRATIHYGEGNIELAASLAQQSFELRPDVSVGLAHLNWLLELEAFAEAMAFLGLYEAVFAVEISRREGLANLIDGIRANLP